MNAALSIMGCRMGADTSIGAMTWQALATIKLVVAIYKILPPNQGKPATVRFRLNLQQITAHCRNINVSCLQATRTEVRTFAL